MLTDEQKARLNPEQLVIAEKWEREKEQTGKIFEKLQKAIETHDNDLWNEALKDNADHMPSSICEHDRSIWKHYLEALCGMR